jgi:hypothetical protein
LKGLSPFKNNPSPSPLKERGIKGVRFIKISLTKGGGQGGLNNLQRIFDRSKWCVII